MTCKDCIHYDVCQYKYNIMSKLKNDDVQKYCLNFKDKSKFIEVIEFQELVADMKLITNGIVETLPTLLNKVVERFPYVVDEAIKEYVEKELKELNE